MSEEKKSVEQQVTEGYRFQLSSTNVKTLERVCADLVAKAEQYGFDKKGPVRFPTKVLSITTRKTPNGEGSKTYEHHELKIHKRNIIISGAKGELNGRLYDFKPAPGVDIKISIVQN